MDGFPAVGFLRFNAPNVELTQGQPSVIGMPRRHAATISTERRVSAVSGAAIGRPGEGVRLLLSLIGTKETAPRRQPWRCPATRRRVGSDRSALSALRPPGFLGPPSEPDVHLSLCIRLSKGFREVRRLHPFELEPLGRNKGHAIVLGGALGPDLSTGMIPAGPTPCSGQLLRGDALVLAPQPQPEPIVHIPVQCGQDAFGPDAVAEVAGPPPEDWIDLRSSPKAGVPKRRNRSPLAWTGPRRRSRIWPPAPPTPIQPRPTTTLANAVGAACFGFEQADTARLHWPRHRIAERMC